MCFCVYGNASCVCVHVCVHVCGLICLYSNASVHARESITVCIQICSHVYLRATLCLCTHTRIHAGVCTYILHEVYTLPCRYARAARISGHCNEIFQLASIARYRTRPCTAARERSRVGVAFWRQSVGRARYARNGRLVPWPKRRIRTPRASATVFWMSTGVRGHASRLFSTRYPVPPDARPCFPYDRAGTLLSRTFQLLPDAPLVNINLLTRLILPCRRICPRSRRFRANNNDSATNEDRPVLHAVR